MSLWGRMRGFLLSDEELGKKDDDHKTSSKPGSIRVPTTWQAARTPRRRSLKRIALFIGVAFLIYLFIHNIPNQGPRMTRPNYTTTGGGYYPSQSHERGSRPKSPGQGSHFPERTYNGAPKFLELAKSLQAISATRGGMLVNRNILFAASSLKSAATLLPLACQMGVESKNYVHFALMSRSDIGMEALQELNGIDASCKIIFHGTNFPARYGRCFPWYKVSSYVPNGILIVSRCPARKCYHLDR